MTDDCASNLEKNIGDREAERDHEGGTTRINRYQIALLINVRYWGLSSQPPRKDIRTIGVPDSEIEAYETKGDASRYIAGHFN